MKHHFQAVFIWRIKLVQKNEKAVVLLSGGLDSTTLAFYVHSLGYSITTLSFSYEQRHKIELKAAKKVSDLIDAWEHVIIETNMNAIGHSSLTDSIPVPKGGKKLGEENYIPITYVPARNLIFLSYAAALAESRDIFNIFLGVNSLDYSGYPDCRPDFIDSANKTINLATRVGREGNSIQIHAPLVRMGKKDIIEMGERLDVPYEYTWSCYDPIIKDGKYYPCGECDSCILRKKGFLKAGVNDPLEFMVDSN